MVAVVSRWWLPDVGSPCLLDCALRGLSDGFRHGLSSVYGARSVVGSQDNHGDGIVDQVHPIGNVLVAGGVGLRFRIPRSDCAVCARSRYDLGEVV